MKLVSKIFLVSISLIYLLTSCSRVNEQAKLIPADADFVGGVDLPKIDLKSKLYANSSFALFDSFTETVDDESVSVLVNGILNDRNESGIDVTSPLYFYLVSEQLYGAIAISLSNSSKFADYLELQLSDEFTKEEKNDIVLYTDERDVIIAFNSETAFFIRLDGAYSADFATKLFTVESENSLVSQSAFMKFLEEAKDVSVFVPSNKLLDFAGKSMEKEISENLAFFGPIKYDDLRDNYLSFSLLFNDKSIELSTDVIVNDSLAKKLREQNLSKSSFSKDILKFVPNSTLVLSSSTFDTKKLIASIETIDKDGQIREMAKQNGIVLEDLISEFGGDLLFSFYGLAVETVEYETTMFTGVDESGYPIFTDTVVNREKTMPKMSVVLSLLQKEKLQTVFDQLGTALFTKVDNYYQLADGFMKGYELYISLQDNVLMLTTDKDAIVLAGKGGYDSSISSNDISKNISPTGYVYVNLDYDTYPESITNMVEKMGVQAFLPSVTSLVQSLEIMSKKEFSATIQLNLKQDNDNSLYQVLHTIDNISGL